MLLRHKVQGDSLLLCPFPASKLGAGKFRHTCRDRESKTNFQLHRAYCDLNYLLKSSLSKDQEKWRIMACLPQDFAQEWEVNYYGKNFKFGTVTCLFIKSDTVYALGSDPPVNDRMVKKSGQRVWKEGQNFPCLNCYCYAHHHPCH